MGWFVGLVLLAAPDFGGEWIHSFGRMTLEQEGDKVTGSYGSGFTIDGTVKDGKLTFTYREGRVEGEGYFDLDESGRSFRGEWKIPANRRSGTWLAWKRDPDAEKGKPAKFGGYWYSNQGTFFLEQKKDKVEGTYGSTGLGQGRGHRRGTGVQVPMAGSVGCGERMARAVEGREDPVRTWPTRRSSQRVALERTAGRQEDQAEGEGESGQDRPRYLLEPRHLSPAAPRRGGRGPSRST